MNVFGLDPESVEARLRTSPTPPAVPTLAQSLWTGGIGFCFVSVVVFAIWAYAGRQLSQALGEPGSLRFVDWRSSVSRGLNCAG